MESLRLIRLRYKLTDFAQFFLTWWSTFTPEDDSTPVHVAVCAVPTLYLSGAIPLPTCTLHYNFLHKLWLFWQFWNHIFTIMWGESRFILIDWRVLLTVKLRPIQSKWFASQNYQDISVSNLCLSHGFNCCGSLLQQLKFWKYQYLRNAIWTVLDTFTVCTVCPI